MAMTPGLNPGILLQCEACSWALTSGSAESRCAPSAAGGFQQWVKNLQAVARREDGCCFSGTSS